METHIQKWGNSLGLRIPSAQAKQLSLKDGSVVELKIEKNHLVIYPKEYNLTDMLSLITEENKHTEELPQKLAGKEVW